MSVGEGILVLSILQTGEVGAVNETSLGLLLVILPKLCRFLIWRNHVSPIA